MNYTADNPEHFRKMLNNLPSFSAKADPVKNKICEALCIMHRLGVPIQGTPLRLERAGMALLAVAGINAATDWSAAVDKQSGYSLRTREIITYVNKHFGEKISSGSYDDVRRHDLALLQAAGIVVGTKPDAARNDSRRGYALDPGYADLIRQYGTVHWEERVHLFMTGRETLTETLTGSRFWPVSAVTLPSGVTLAFGPGKHNDLQRAIIEEFLPRYGYSAEVLYVGDAQTRSLVNDAAKLHELGFFDLKHGELPDVVAYSALKGWIYVIEAVWTGGPVHAVRKLKLDKLLARAKAPVVYVTAFLTRGDFRKHAANIAWETEVWIAAHPEHLIHFNGHKFMGPYPQEQRDLSAGRAAPQSIETSPD
ncbi:MAG: restriction endonuclease [Chloroflexota bacterium]|nr:restriction endonuclease [Chloroflexota bacterium]